MGRKKYKTYKYQGVISGSVVIPIKARNFDEATKKLQKLFDDNSHDKIIKQYNGYCDIEIYTYIAENGKEYKDYESDENEKVE